VHQTYQFARPHGVRPEGGIPANTAIRAANLPVLLGITESVPGRHSSQGRDQRSKPTGVAAEGIARTTHKARIINKLDLSVHQTYQFARPHGVRSEGGTPANAAIRAANLPVEPAEGTARATHKARIINEIGLSVQQTYRFCEASRSLSQGVTPAQNSDPCSKPTGVAGRRESRGPRTKLE
jgi:hypothetical protein